MFEQVTREEQPSGGLAILLTLLHQFIATPGTFSLALLLLGVLVKPLLREAPSVFGALPILLVCLAVALLVGHGVGYIFPGRTGYGYWSWIVPTAFLLLGF